MADQDAKNLELQARVLELDAAGSDVRACLEELCRLVDGVVPDAVCAAMLLGPDTGLFDVDAAPRGTPRLIEALNGLWQGDLAGSDAAYAGRPVFVADTATDPRWAGLRSTAEELGIRSWWSVPILSGDGGVHGSLAVPRREAGAPDLLFPRAAERRARRRHRARPPPRRHGAARVEEPVPGPVRPGP